MPLSVVILMCMVAFVSKKLPVGCLKRERHYLPVFSPSPRS